MFCLRLRITLRLHHLSVHRVNIWSDPDAAAFVRSVADGNETVPVLVVDGDPMVNPDPRHAVARLRV
jgi:mycoredoxin